jgi:hypothetical protein
MKPRTQGIGMPVEGRLTAYHPVAKATDNLIMAARKKFHAGSRTPGAPVALDSDAGKYELDFDFESVPKLCKRFGLTMTKVAN